MELPAALKDALKGALAEFYACLLFVFFGAGSVSGALAATGDAGPVEPVNYAISFGFSITILAFSIRDHSGGHINPAVTLSMMLSRNISPVRGLIYIVAQVAGATAGGGLLFVAVGEKNYASGIGLAIDITSAGGFILEFVGTFLLCFVVFHVAVSAGGVNDWAHNTIGALAPIPIGFAVLVSHLTLGPFTGCGINPARVIGAVVWEPGFWDSHAGQNFWIYLAGPFLASFLAPLSFASLSGYMKAVAPEQGQSPKG